MNREGRKAGPTGGRGATLDQEAGKDREAAHGQEPEGQRVDARERHVQGADLQRNEVVPESGQRREDEQEDHQGAVLGEDLVIRVRGQDLGARPGEFRSHQQRQDAAHHEEGERVAQVQNPDALVVRRGEPPEHAPPERLGAGRRGRLDDSHVTSLLVSGCPR